MRSSTLTLVASSAGVLAGANGVGQHLTFNSDGTFQISIFEDIHLGEAPATFGPTQDALTISTIEGILDAENADFVVINGDVISRDNLMPNSTEYLDQALAPLVARDLTWSMLYGNHESNRARNVSDVFAREQAYPNARTRSMISSTKIGLTNYYLPVYSADCPSGCGCEPELLIWFFDSRGGFNFNQSDASGAQVYRDTWVDQEVVDWFVGERDRLAAKFTKTVPSIAFVHIPIHAYYAIQTGPGIDPNRNPGANTNFEIGQASGFCSDGVRNGTCPYGGQDIPFMQSLVETEGLMGVFVAHLHGNSWCYKWTDETMPEYPVQPSEEGLNICFGQRSGFGGAYEAQRGSRQLLLRQDKIANGEFETWVRLQTGEVVGEVSLNATFGQDVYPEAPYIESFCEECFQWEDYKPNIPN